MNKKYVILVMSILFLTLSCGESDNIGIDGYLIEKSGSSSINGSFISIDKAEETAMLFMKHLLDKASTRSYSESPSVKTICEEGKPIMYVFNYPNGGFVIISATKDYYPILAYSDEFNFDTSLNIDGVTSWIEETKDAVSSCESLSDSIKARIRDIWESLGDQDYLVPQKKSSTRSGLTDAEIACYMRCEDLLNQYGYEGEQGWHFCPLSDAKQTLTDIGYSALYDGLCYSAEFNHSTPSTSVLGWKFCTEKDTIGPLIQTSWHQYSPFNDYCNGHVTGCGAIAMAQVMNYYKYPSQFTYGDKTYDWSYYSYPALIKYVYNNIGSEHIDILGIEAVYTTPENMKKGIKKLGYSVSVSDDDPYKVEQEIMSGHRPVIMLGNDTNIPLLPSPASYIGNSHYWICDGMRRMTQRKLYIFTEWQPNGNGNFVSGWGTIDNPDPYGGVVYCYSHMNWGWGGKCNGWFVNNTNPGCGSEYDYPKIENEYNKNFKHARKNFYIKRQY